jgi:hypothetical protein
VIVDKEDYRQMLSRRAAKAALSTIGDNGSSRQTVARKTAPIRVAKTSGSAPSLMIGLDDGISTPRPRSPSSTHSHSSHGGLFSGNSPVVFRLVSGGSAQVHGWPRRGRHRGHSAPLGSQGGWGFQGAPQIMWRGRQFRSMRRVASTVRNCSPCHSCRAFSDLEDNGSKVKNYCIRCPVFRRTACVDFVTLKENDCLSRAVPMPSLVRFPAQRAHVLRLHF